MVEDPDPDDRRFPWPAGTAGPAGAEVAAGHDPGSFVVGRPVEPDAPAGQGDREYATVDRSALADGLVVLGDDARGPALLAALAGQAAHHGSGVAVLSGTGPTAAWFARALPDERAAALRVVAGTDGHSVNLLDPGIPPDAPAFLDAVDAVADALASLAVVVDPRLRDAVREYVMAACTAGDGATLADLRAFVRAAAAGDEDGVPDWVRESSPDLPERVEALDEEAVGRFSDSLEPFLRPPARALLCDPDPDVALLEAVRAGAPLSARLDDSFGPATRLAIGRALGHFLWAGAREFADADAPYCLVADEAGPVVDAEPHLDRLLARLHRDPVIPALGVRDPATVADGPWAHLASEAGAGAAFAHDDPVALERAAALAGADAERIASLPAGQFLFGDGESGAARRIEAFAPP